MTISIMTNPYYRENKHNDIQHIDAQHNDKQHNDTQPIDSQPIDTCLTLGQMTIRIMTSGIKKITNKFMFTECKLFYHYSECCYSDQYQAQNLCAIYADCRNTEC